MILHPAVREVAERRERIEKALRTGNLASKDSVALTEHYAFVYKDGPTPVLGMGRSGAARSDEANDADYSIPFIITVYDEDRDGDIVVPKGCQLGNYIKNPVVFFGHQSWEIPIATSRAPDGRVSVYVEENLIRAKAYFDCEDDDAMRVYGKVKRGMLNATSMAFVPIEAYRRDQEEKWVGEDKARTHGQAAMPPGWLFKTYDLTEWSVVGVPSNAGAIRDWADEKDMSPRLKKALMPYAAQAKGCWNGWCPQPDGTCKPCEEKPMPKKSKCACKGKCSKCKAAKAQNQADIESAKPAPSQDARAKACKCANCKSIHKCPCGKQCKCVTKAIMTKSFVISYPSPGGDRYWDGSKWVKDQSAAVKYSSQSEAQAALTAIGSSGGKVVQAKALLESSGGAGGYSVAVSDNTTSTETDGTKACAHCEGSGNCKECGGDGIIKGKECWKCKGSGECEVCGGIGQVKKQTKESKMATKKAKKEAEAAAPFMPKSSAMVLAKMYHGYKEAGNYGAESLKSMDNPGVAEHLTEHLKSHHAKAMQHLKDGLEEHHPDHDMDDLVKGFETDNASPVSTGEEGKVDNGEVPPDATKALETDPENSGAAPFNKSEALEPQDEPGAEPFDKEKAADGQCPECGGQLDENGHCECGYQKSLTDEGNPEEIKGEELETQDQGAAPYNKDADPNEKPADADPDTEEILERYQTPKGWATRKLGRVRRTKDGRMYIVRRDLTNEGNPAELKSHDQLPPALDAAYQTLLRRARQLGALKNGTNN